MEGTWETKPPPPKHHFQGADILRKPQGVLLRAGALVSFCIGFASLVNPRAPFSWWHWASGINQGTPDHYNPPSQSGTIVVRTHFSYCLIIVV